MKAFMDSIDIFILSSVHEGSANSLLEAMAYAKPVVAFDISSNPEIVVPHLTGLLAAFPDTRQLAQHIETLIRNPDLGRSYGYQGRRRIAHKFSRTENIQRLLNLINT
jgi:glycosyltransferase involved in cell wall biosynthesis